MGCMAMLQPSMNLKQSSDILRKCWAISICYRTCAIWWALSFGVFVLLASHRNTYSPKSNVFIARTYGWPGGWLTCNRYKSGKTSPPGQWRLDTYITDWKSCSVAVAVSLAAPGLIMLPLRRRFKWFETTDAKLSRASASFLAAALFTIPVFFVVAFFARLAEMMNR